MGTSNKCKEFEEDEHKFEEDEHKFEEDEHKLIGQLLSNIEGVGFTEKLLLIKFKI